MPFEDDGIPSQAQVTGKELLVRIVGGEFLEAEDLLQSLGHALTRPVGRRHLLLIHHDQENVGAGSWTLHAEHFIGTHYSAQHGAGRESGRLLDELSTCSFHNKLPFYDITDG